MYTRPSPPRWWPWGRWKEKWKVSHLFIWLSELCERVNYSSSQERGRELLLWARSELGTFVESRTFQTRKEKAHTASLGRDVMALGDCPVPHGSRSPRWGSQRGPMEAQAGPHMRGTEGWTRGIPQAGGPGGEGQPGPRRLRDEAAGGRSRVWVVSQVGW